MYEFKVQEKKRIRVILDTDAACEADDQYAIVHALLTPRFIIKGIMIIRSGYTTGLIQGISLRISSQSLPYGLKTTDERS
ncbi:MAG: hypothetical protein K6G24_13990 [Lachnospiraceae bacterium]|nr:hypothetical protein [Lachnospiraceae bacterium]